MEWRQGAVLSLAAPEDFPKAFTDAWHTRDGRLIAALFSEDADFVNVTGIWWRSREAIAKAHDTALKSFFSETRLNPGTVRTRTLGTGHAIVHCRFHLTGQRAPDGSTAEARTTLLVFVLERTPDGWQAVCAQNTDVVPGAETYVNTGTLSPVDYRDK